MTTAPAECARHAGLLFAVFCGCLLTKPSFADQPALSWHDAVLTVHADHADRPALLRDVSRLTRTPIDGLEFAAGSVTIDLVDAPLRSALLALVNGFSVALTEFSDQPNGAPVGYAVRINGPMPPPPDGLPNLAPEQPESTAAPPLPGARASAPGQPALPERAR